MAGPVPMSLPIKRISGRTLLTEVIHKLYSLLPFLGVAIVQVSYGDNRL